MDKEDLLISADDIDNVSQEDMDELEEIIEEYIFELQRHDDNLDHILGRINNSDVYKELGISIHVSTEYMYSVDEKEE